MYDSVSVVRGNTLLVSEVLGSDQGLESNPRGEGAQRPWPRDSACT